MSTAEYKPNPVSGVGGVPVARACGVFTAAAPVYPLPSLRLTNPFAPLCCCSPTAIGPGQGGRSIHRSRLDWYTPVETGRPSGQRIYHGRLRAGALQARNLRRGQRRSAGCPLFPPARPHAAPPPVSLCGIPGTPRRPSHDPCPLPHCATPVSPSQPLLRKLCETHRVVLLNEFFTTKRCSACQRCSGDVSVFTRPAPLRGRRSQWHPRVLPGLGRATRRHPQAA